MLNLKGVFEIKITDDPFHFSRFKLSAGLNLETFDTILSGTNHI